MVEIRNNSKGFVISSDAQLRDSFWGRFRGLMLSRRKDIVLAVAKEGVLSSTIHMMFMLYSIDVVWVSSDMRVVDVRQNVPPFNPLNAHSWGMHKPDSAAKYVVEIADGDIGQTQKGDVLEFI